MIISLGILAYNEAQVIEKTLQSLFTQNLFQELDNNTSIEVIVVPNGCSDQTAEIAQKTLEHLVCSLNSSSVSWQVCEIQQAGKSNAWNVYVHQLSNPRADYLILMDADIEFVEPLTLYHLIEALETNPQIWVSVDQPIKDIAFKNNKNLLEKLSVGESKINHHAICGQLYCGRAEVFRKMWMPPQLPVEDGFLRAMVLTDGFTSPEIFSRIDLASQASHLFHAASNPFVWLRHEKRLLLGSTINAILFGYLWKNCGQEQDAGSLIKANNEKNPNWLEELLAETVQEKGGWVIPHQFYFRRLYSLRRQAPLKALLRLPFNLTFFLVDLYLCFQANWQIKKGKAVRYW